MTDAATPEQTFVVTLTEVQQNILLNALYEKLVETKQYLSSYRHDKEPGPLDTCCAGHLARFNERKRSRDALLDRKRRVRTLINLFESADPTTTTQTAAVELDAVTLVYTDEDGQTHEQPLSDLTTAGTLIDPQNGDDLELHSARIQLPADHGTNAV